MTLERITVFGGDALHESVTALGYETAADGAPVAVIDIADRTAVARAAACPSHVVRIFICPADERERLAALGIASERIASGADPSVLGPVLAAAMPQRRRSATRTVVVTGVRGGVGRTLLVANLARRLAPRLRTCVIDATGSGAVGWWLGCDARAWSELEALADELTADQLGVVAHDVAPNIHLVGGLGAAPTTAILVATARAAVHLDDLAILDLPPVGDAGTRALREIADRSLVLAYDDPLSLHVLDAGVLGDGWLIASQSAATRIGAHEAFRALPRDESAVRAALGGRAKAGGALGRAYDELAELLAVDAS